MHLLAVPGIRPVQNLCLLSILTFLNILPIRIDA